MSLRPTGVMQPCALAATPEVRAQSAALSDGSKISGSARRANELNDQARSNGAWPASASAGALQSPGDPIEPGAAMALGNRLRFDLSVVRVHADSAAASAARALGARAYTLGPHVVFGAGAYQPHTMRGLSLLAHELAHVSQQLSGNTAPDDELERQAQAVEAGASLTASEVGSHRAALHLRAGDAMSLVIVLGPDGGASFTAEVEGGGTVTGTGSVAQLEPGEYRAHSTGGEVIITAEDGSTIPRANRFDLPWSPTNAALIRALSGATTPIPLHVERGRPSTEGPEEPGAFDAQRRELEALPERIRNFLFGERGPTNVRPDEYAVLLRVAQRIAELSDAELAEYDARTTRQTTSAVDFEASVYRWLSELEARRGAEGEQDQATQALFGMDEIYEMYRSWQNGLLMSAPPSWISTWEALPVSALPARADGMMNQLYLQMRRSLLPFNFNNLAAFTTAIQRFLSAFRENAYYISLDLLDRYEHQLVEQSLRYQGGAESSSLHAALAPARATFERADEQARSARAQHGGLSPTDVHDYYAAGLENQEIRAQGQSQVTAQAGAHPLLTNPDFPVEELGRADEAGVGRILHDYISSRLDDVRGTRSRLGDNHELIFKLDILVAQTKARQGIGPDSIWSKIIADHQAPTMAQMELDMAVAVLAVALALLSGGSGLAAVASLGLSSHLALQQYEDYAFRSDAYGAELLSEEPSLAWVILAIIGVVADFAVVSRVLRPIRPALQDFQRTGDIAALEGQLGGVEERIRRSILARAEIEVQARSGWEGVVPRGALRISLLGADVIADLLGKVVYSIILNLRRGINTFNRWLLTREAVDLIGDINNLRPEELQRLGVLYRQAVGDAQRVTTHGRSLGMTPEEVEAAVQGWAQRGSGSTDDLMREMTRREVVIDRTTATGPVTRSSLPRGHVGGVRVEGPNGSYLQFLPLDDAGRARGVVARLNADMLAQRVGATASGEIPGRAAAQDRGHLLARILGGPDIPQNLAPLLNRVNQRDMRMVEIAIRNAIRDGGEATLTVTPIYSAGRATSDPTAFLMSVRWRDGAHEVFRFANP